MSRHLENVSLTKQGSDDTPIITQGETLQRATNHFDDFGDIFSMYLERSNEENKKLVEGWKVDADGMLIFAGVFPAAVAALLAVSVQNMQQNP